MHADLTTDRDRLKTHGPHRFPQMGAGATVTGAQSSCDVEAGRVELPIAALGEMAGNGEGKDGNGADAGQQISSDKL